ncbi:MAG: Dabb family protein, partial [Bdellovibrionales bacterium]|nr:Dabb family protein [Bdellovibrionales bacterium]
MKNLMSHLFRVIAILACVLPAIAATPLPNLTLAQAQRITHPGYRPGYVKHFVAFRFQTALSKNQIAEVARRFKALELQCQRDGRPYIKSIDIGVANSFEGADQDKTLGVIVTFQSEGDRNYYVGQPLIDQKFRGLYDPAHVAFKEFVGPLLAT